MMHSFVVFLFYFLSFLAVIKYRDCLKVASVSVSWTQPPQLQAASVIAQLVKMNELPGAV